ncbi:MAG: mechanosensitive ion channel [Candidatus Omnitrophica bacterium]|nr:mechanosensitive ion channel [Candidatus Omnitrophota bacterium]
MIQNLVSTVAEFLVHYSLQVVGAVIIAALGLAASDALAKALFQLLQRRKLDVTLARFLSNVLKVLILGFAMISALGNFGITVAPLIAALSAVAFGATMAIQGPLSNYGAGLSIILTRPFVVGHSISVAGVSGVVEEVKLASTVLVNEDGVKIVIPNKSIVGEILHNSRTARSAEGTIGIAYEDDPEKAVRLIEGVLQSAPGVDVSHKASVGIRDFGESSVNLEYRYWVPTLRYYETIYAVNLAVFKALKEQGITIPFPQREVRVLSGAAVKAE